MVSAKPRIAVMPAGLFQIPAIRDAQDMGFDVVAFDGNPNAPGLKLANFPQAVNPMDVEHVTAIARAHAVKGVVCVANDPCIVPASRVCDALSLPGLSPDRAMLMRDKARVRERLRNSLPQYGPRFCIVNGPRGLPRVSHECGWPAVLKPCLASGSKGVCIVRSEAELENAYRYTAQFAKEERVLAEEMLTGQEVSVEGIVASGVARIAAITDKVTTPPPYCVEIGHSIPSRLPQPAQDAICACVRDIVRELALNDCAFHAEIFATDQGPKLVEFGARLGGGCITSHLVPLATGVNLNRAVISMAVGDPPDVTPARSLGSAIRFLTPAPGRVAAVHGLAAAQDAPGVVEVVCNLSSGSLVSRLENSDHRVGYVIATGPDATAAMTAATDAAARIEIQTA